MTLKPVPVWLIVLLGALLWGGEYVRRDLWEPDEARFALVAKEMREGHWLVPYRQGEFYTHKPPLMFWLTNLSSLFTGGQIGNVAPRIPSFLGAILALWAASRLATRWFSAQAGWITVFLQSTTFLFWQKGGFGQIDMLLCGLSMTVLYFFFSACDSTEGGARQLFFGYVFTGLAVLAKGPVGFLVPWGILLMSMYFAGPCHLRSRFHLLWGPLVMLAFPGCWLLLAWLQGAPEGFFNELLFHQNVGRVTGEFGGHQKPFYYFFYYFPLDGLPWTILMPLSYAVLKRVPEAEKGRMRLTVWILFTIVFFSLSASKRNLYILIVYPAAAMLVAAATDYWSRADDRWLTYSFRILSGLFLVMAAGMMIAPLVPTIPFNAWSMFPGGLLLATGWWMAVRYRRIDPRSPRWLMAMSGSVLLTFASIGALVFPAIDDLKTPDELIEKAHRILAPDERILMYRMQGEIFSLYTDRKGFMAQTDEEAIGFLRNGSQSRHLVLLLEADAPQIGQWLEIPPEVMRFSSGSKKLLAFETSDAAIKPNR